MAIYKVIGMMSGTSLDGIDLAYCTFEYKEDLWGFKIEKSITIEYPKDWKYNLKESIYKNKNQLQSLDKLYGEFLGITCKNFIKDYDLDPDLIASHGHTVFHNPDKGFTLQIGNGEKIARICNTPTVYDFRSTDVKLGGQGAPLVPIGDKLLFSEFDFCLNLGGFANISFDKNNKRIAFDICPVNIVINELCEQIGLDYDKDGKIAQKGNIDTVLLTELNNLDYYQKAFPKSLGKEFIIEKVNPILNKYSLSIEDQLRTFYEHIAKQIASILNSKKGNSILISGGGAYNVFLIELIRKHINKKIILPSKEIIEYKEAIIFAFLGVLKLRNENNCLASVTGASSDNSGGIFIMP